MTDLILTRDQVRRVDRLAVEEYDMPSMVLMENAGRNAAQVIKHRYAGLAEKRVAIVCGPGNNGGDGFCIARHLHNAGWAVRVVLVVPDDKLTGDALVNYQIIRKTTIPIESTGDEALAWAELLVDALLGTGFAGQVREPLNSLIDRINAAGKPIVAVDVPSGLDCQTGDPAASTIQAELTISFVAVKTGMTLPQARPYVGETVTADIGVPIELIRHVVGQS